VANYLRQRDASKEAALDAMEFKLWAERRLGELDESPPSGRGKKAFHRDTLSRMERLRFRRIFEIPEEKFIEHIAEQREAGELTGWHRQMEEKVTWRYLLVSPRSQRKRGSRKHAIR
jgi:hypothetical protein